MPISQPSEVPDVISIKMGAMGFPNFLYDYNTFMAMVLIKVYNMFSP